MSLQVDIRHRHATGFDLEVAFRAQGGVTALFGRSGSGKSTVVNAVAGLLRPDSGSVRLGDRVMVDTGARVFQPAHKRRIGYVFQDHRLFPHLSVVQNLSYGIRFAKDRPQVMTLEQIAQVLGITPLLDRRPGSLSGGERARVAIGRALLARPELLLMDEPLASLDTQRKAEILPYLERLRDETGVPILYVSHEIGEVARLASTVVMLEAGRVVRTGPAQELLSDPALAPRFGIREVGSVLPGVVLAHHPDGLTEVRISAGSVMLPHLTAPEGTHVRIRIAAKDVMLSTNRPEGLSALNILPAEVTDLRQGDGPGVMVQLRAGTDRILARITRRSAEALKIAPGVRCYGVIKTVAVASADVGQQQSGFGPE